MLATLAWLVVLVVLGLGSPVAAQDRLFVSGGVTPPPYTEEIAPLDSFGTSLGPRSPLVHQPLIAGGRYAVSATAFCDLTPCLVVDWQGVAHPLPYAFVSIVATDPVRARVFVQTASGAVDAVDVETGAVTPMFPASLALTGPCRYAFSAGRLFCVEGGATPSLRVFATSGAAGDTPQAVSTVASRPSGNPVWLVTPDGSRLFSGTPGVASDVLVLAYLASGESRSASLPPFYELAWDDFNERLIVAPAPRLGHVFTKDLTHLGSVLLPFPTAALAVSPATGRLYLRGLFPQSAGYGDAYTAAFDSGTYAPLTPTVHSQGFGGPPRVTVLGPPGASRDLSAVVNGRNVALTWTNVGAASSFLLDVGVAPGQTALTVPLSWSPQAAFAAVPPGSYFVRVRGVNAFGAGRPSAELRIVVP